MKKDLWHIEITAFGWTERGMDPPVELTLKAAYLPARPLDDQVNTAKHEATSAFMALFALRPSRVSASIYCLIGDSHE